MPSPEPKNPYHRANSLPELLSWHDIDFVRCAYVTVLGRQPDPNGEAHYLDRLRQGYSKLSLLWELRRSPEGPYHDPGIAGFDKALRKHRNAQRPVVGWAVRWMTGREANSPMERRLRAIENLLGDLPKQLGQAQWGAAITTAANSEPDEIAIVPPNVEQVLNGLSPKGQQVFQHIRPN